MLELKKYYQHYLVLPESRLDGGQLRRGEEARNARAKDWIETMLIKTKYLLNAHEEMKSVLYLCILHWTHGNVIFDILELYLMLKDCQVLLCILKTEL